MEIVKHWQREVEYLSGKLPGLLANAKKAEEDYDYYEIDYLYEVYHINKSKVECLTQYIDLALKLENAYFSGENLTILQIVQRLVEGFSEKWLKKAIRAMGFKPGDQIYYRKVCDVPTKSELEAVLTSCSKGGDFVVAKDFCEKLEVGKNTKYYTMVKRELEEAGWSWKSRRVKGVKVKVIEPPCSTMEPEILKIGATGKKTAPPVLTKSELNNLFSNLFFTGGDTNQNSLVIPINRRHRATILPAAP